MPDDKLRLALELLSLSLRSIDDKDPEARYRCRASAWMHLAEAQKQAGDQKGALEAVEMAKDLMIVWTFAGTAAATPAG